MGRLTHTLVAAGPIASVAMFETLFEFLFKYRPIVFDEGSLAFRPTTATFVAAIVVVAIGVVRFQTYQRVRANTRPADTRGAL